MSFFLTLRQKMNPPELLSTLQKEYYALCDKQSKISRANESLHARREYQADLFRFKSVLSSITSAISDYVDGAIDRGERQLYEMEGIPIEKHAPFTKSPLDPYRGTGRLARQMGLTQKR